MGAKQRAVCSTFECSPFKLLTTTVILQPRTHARQRPPPEVRYQPTGLHLGSSKHLLGHSSGLWQRDVALVTIHLGVIVPPCGRTHRFPTESPKRSRSMHDESLRCISPVLGCKHKPEVLCAFQASSRLNNTAGPSITAWTLPALRLASCALPQRHNTKTHPETTVTVLDPGTCFCCAASAGADPMAPSSYRNTARRAGLRNSKHRGPTKHERSAGQPLRDDQSVVYHKPLGLW